MSETTPIEWTDATWSPWEGCTKVGLGCDHCYAEAMNNWLRKGANWGPGAPRREYSDAHWAKPLKWNAKAAATGVRMRVFPSVCDPFDNEVDPVWRARFFALIRATPHLDWLLLTKRIGNAAEMIRFAIGAETSGWPWRNIWLGATVVNQEEADRDIPKLLATRARVRFLSIEPMLGPIRLDRWLWTCCGNMQSGSEVDGQPNGACCNQPERADQIDWVIAGGESGRGARPAHPDWFRSLRDQCDFAGVPFLFKQWGEWIELAPSANTVFDMATNEGRAAAEFCAGFVSPMGHFVHHMHDAPTDEPYRGLLRPGKKAAGRLLDGVEHNGVPS